MKNLWILMMLLPLSTFAQQKKAPAPFQNSDITRKLEDGTLQKFDGDEYKIVKRNQKPVKPKVKVIKERVEVTKTVVKIKPPKKNRITLYGGVGPNELDGRRLNDSTTRVELDNEAVFGVGYSRRLNDTLSLEVMGLTNETVLGGVGLEF